MSFNIPEFTVSEFSRSIKNVIEDAFGYVKIKGEITSFKRASSGHLYFSLKDESATLSAVCFRGAASAINFEIADGLQVAALGRITTFEGRSNYQIIIEKLEIAGIGAILEMIEKRRQKLFEEGLFDAIHKKPLPFFPKIIGVITSETGAVIQDIKHRIEARCPCHVKLYPTLVQGEKAALEIINGLKFFNKLKIEKPEVIIIARGGGSFEDLLPFNDEALIRAVFASDIPVISAVGHETDTTLIDYVSDLRAPTPTAAAELATPVLFDLKNRLNFLSDKIKILPQNFLQEKFLHIKNLQRYIIDPAKIVDQMRQRFLSCDRRFEFLIKSFLEKNAQKLSSLTISNRAIFNQINLLEQKTTHLAQLLKSKIDGDLSYKKNNIENLGKLLKANHYHEILKKGFSLVKNQNGEVVSSSTKIKAKEKIFVEMFDGKIDAYVLEISNSSNKDENAKTVENPIQPTLI